VWLTEAGLRRFQRESVGIRASKAKRGLTIPSLHPSNVHAKVLGYDFLGTFAWK
jgi:hypothetical protein